MLKQIGKKLSSTVATNFHKIQYDMKLSAIKRYSMYTLGLFSLQSSFFLWEIVGVVLTTNISLDDKIGRKIVKTYL